MDYFPLHELKASLETLCEIYHRAEYRIYDPVSLPWQYATLEDQELAGLWAGLFAWGRRDVAIQKASQLLESLSSSPAEALKSGVPIAVRWSHRTWSPADMAALWRVLRQLYRREGNLAGFFWRRRSDWMGAITALQEAILSQAPQLVRHIGYIPRGSAAKRLQLWLRWMVRRDCIDPGPWEGFSPAVLYLPVDTHVLSWARQHRLCSQQAPSWRIVLRLTELFRRLSPADPLRYDFALVTAAALRRGIGAGHEDDREPEQGRNPKP